MAVTRVQGAVSFNGSHTWGATPTTGNLLTVVATKTWLDGTDFTAPSGWSTAVNQAEARGDAAIFYKIADGTETTDTVGNAGSTDRYYFSEWAPGSGQQWPTNPVEASDAAGISTGGATSIGLSSLAHADDGVALLAFAPGATITGEGLSGASYTSDYTAQRIAAYLILSGSGTVAATTVSWTNSVEYAAAHVTLVTETASAGANPTPAAVAPTVTITTPTVEALNPTVSRVQEAMSFNGAHTWATAPTAGNLLTVVATKSGLDGLDFTAPSGWSTAINRAQDASDAAIFWKIATGSETTDTVGNAASSDRYYFSEWAPGSGRQWPTNPVDDTAGVGISTGSSTTAVLDAITHSAGGLALLAFAPGASISGESLSATGYTTDFSAQRIGAYQILSSAGTVASTTVSWSTAAEYAASHATFITEAEAGTVTAEPAAVTVTCGIATPVVSTGGGVNVIAAAIVLSAVLGAPVANPIAPTEVAAAVAADEPTIAATNYVEQTMPTYAVVIDTPTVSTAEAASVTPAAVAASATITQPSISTGQSVSVAPLPATATCGVDVPSVPVWSPAVDSTINALLDVRPVPYSGHRLGIYDDADLDWYLSVEVGLPSTDGVWGVGTWGETFTFGRVEWSDITSDTRGIEWRRGADEPFGRPRIGQLRFTLDNRDDEWNPFPASTSVAPAYYAPGTLVRVSVHSPDRSVMDGWVPQFTGLVDSWEHVTRGVGADALIEVTAWETLRFLSNIDENALSSVVGIGDDGGERIDRLLTASGWPYGAATIDAENLRFPPDVASGFWDLQSTDMANNRLAEVYLAADSTDVVVRSGRNGRATVYAPYYFGYTDTPSAEVWPLAEVSWSDPTFGSGTSVKIPGIGFDWSKHRVANTSADFLYVPYDADSLDIANDDLFLTNDVRFAAAGSTQQTHEQTESIARYGRRTLVRSDLQSRYDSTVLFIAAATGARRGLNTLRVENMDISTSDRGADVYLAMIAADIGVEAYIYPPSTSAALDRPRIRGFVRAFTHRIEPRTPTKGVTWRTSVSVDTWTVQGLPAAQLNDTPL